MFFMHLLGVLLFLFALKAIFFRHAYARHHGWHRGGCHGGHHHRRWGHHRHHGCHAGGRGEGAWADDHWVDDHRADDRWEDDLRGFRDAPRRGAGPFGAGPFGFGRGSLGRLFGLADELELTPSQRRTVHEALRDLKASFKRMRPETAQTRDDLGRVMRSEDFDVEILGELFSRHDDLLTEARKEATGALGKIHAVLDDVQRARLASLLARG